MGLLCNPALKLETESIFARLQRLFGLERNCLLIFINDRCQFLSVGAASELDGRKGRIDRVENDTARWFEYFNFD